MSHPSTLISTPEALANASETERLRAANAVIAKLRQQRSQARHLPQANVPAVTTLPRQPCTRAAGLSKTPVEHAPLSAVPGGTSDQPSTKLDSRSGFTAALAKHPLQFAAVASVGALGGVLLMSLLHNEHNTLNLTSIAPRMPDSQRHVHAEAAHQIATLEARNAELAKTIMTLEAETSSLQNELLALELETLKTSVAGVQEFDLNNAVPDVGEQVVTEPPDDKAVDAADQTQAALLPADFTTLTDAQIANAIARAQEALDEIESRRTDSSANYAELDAARRLVNDQLVAAIGIDNMAAGRHALGEPNLLSISDVDDPTSTVLEGDVLVSVDGQRVLDAQQLRWIENDSVDAIDDAGESSETHILEVLRDGQLIALVFDAPIGQLIVEEKSVQLPVIR